MLNCDHQCDNDLIHHENCDNDDIHSNSVNNHEIDCPVIDAVSENSIHAPNDSDCDTQCDQMLSINPITNRNRPKKGKYYISAIINGIKISAFADSGAVIDLKI